METYSYRTIKSPVDALYKVSGSKHTAYAYPVKDEEEIRLKIEALRKQFHDATHVCYAWRLGADQNNFRANDDGEPSGTAGKPILGQLQSFELTNVLVCVVRYFGGTKLGTGGLIDAYKTATRMALEQAEITEHLIYSRWKIHFPYDLQGKIMRWIKENGIQKIEFTQADEISMLIEIPLREEKELLKQLSEMYMLRFVKM